MKHIITLFLFAAPFVINAQEPPANQKKTSTPPANEKAITEKGVSSTKSRGISKKTDDAPAPPPATETKSATTTTATTSEKPHN